MKYWQPTAHGAIDWALEYECNDRAPHAVGCQCDKCYTTRLGDDAPITNDCRPSTFLDGLAA